MKNTKIPLALPIPGFRRGLLGNLPVDAAYLRGVKARGRMLAKACRLKTGARQGGATGSQLSLSLETMEK